MHWLNIFSFVLMMMLGLIPTFMGFQYWWSLTNIRATLDEIYEDFSAAARIRSSIVGDVSVLIPSFYSPFYCHFSSIFLVFSQLLCVCWVHQSGSGIYM